MVNYRVVCQRGRESQVGAKGASSFLSVPSQSESVTKSQPESNALAPLAGISGSAAGTHHVNSLVRA